MGRPWGEQWGGPLGGWGVLMPKNQETDPSGGTGVAVGFWPPTGPLLLIFPLIPPCRS